MSSECFSFKGRNIFGDGSVDNSVNTFNMTKLYT